MRCDVISIVNTSNKGLYQYGRVRNNPLFVWNIYKLTKLRSLVVLVKLYSYIADTTVIQ